MPGLELGDGHGAGDPQPPVILCVEVGETAMEPMCSIRELQFELVPYVMSQSLQSAAFLKLPKAERQARVKVLTQKMLGGESGAGGDADSEEEMCIGPQQFWAHLRNKYNTSLGRLLQTLGFLEHRLRERPVVVLRFESEAVQPSASLLVRSSRPVAGSATPLAAAAARREFGAGDFSAAVLGTWLREPPAGGGRCPPLWSSLTSECARYPPEMEPVAIFFCTETNSTDNAPEALTLAAHCLAQIPSQVPCLTGVSFGAISSERLAALEEVCAWAGGMSFNVSDFSALEQTAESLAAQVFGPGGGSGAATSANALAAERRTFYAQKQSLGTCFLSLPMLAGHEAGSAGNVAAGQDGAVAAPVQRQYGAGSLPDMLLRENSTFDGTVPSDAMLAVLLDVSLTPMRRWSRSLRCWREYRGLRDVVFSEPGGLGMELDEPQASANDDPSTRSWRLRSTHPPASSLKMELQSTLVAINHTRVSDATLRSEIARRIAMRPVNLTFRSPQSGDVQAARGDAALRLPFGGAMLSMVVSELSVGELREGLPPIKTASPPLSTALQRVSVAKEMEGRGARLRQAERLLKVVASSSGAAAAAAGAAAAGSSGGSCAAAVPEAAFVRAMLFCGEVMTLAQASAACRPWSLLALEGAKLPASLAAEVPNTREGGSNCYRLWRWVLRWGGGPPSRRRLDFWRWALSLPAQPVSTAEFDTPAYAQKALLEAALRVDAAGLLGLSRGLSGACPGAEVASETLGRMSEIIFGHDDREAQAIPPDLVERLLGPPFNAQSLWMLTSGSLSWLVAQGRIFQVLLAAHHPQVFRAFFGEGVAPELFFCWWLQGFFRGCILGEEEVLRIWDIFIWERSYKIFLRTALAIFGLLEKKFRGKDVEVMMKVLFNPKLWELEPGKVLAQALETKVTRSMIREIEQVDSLCPS